MTTWFVTRHTGALDWARQQGIVNEADGINVVSEILPEQVTFGDVVIGTLPTQLVAEICSRGGRYLHIAMTVPTEKRSVELSAEEMVQFGAVCKQFVVFASDEQSVAQQPFLPHAHGEGVHICLVSDQHMANLLPILKRRPAQIELICTPEMMSDGGGLERLANALQHFGYTDGHVTPHKIDTACSTDFEMARRSARKLRDVFIAKYPAGRLTLNATGGTKALSTAFFIEFQGFEVIYTDSQKGNCIRFLDDQRRNAEPLDVQIGTIEDYLRCQGYEIVAAASNDVTYAEVARRRLATTRLLIENATSHVFSILNSGAGEIEVAILGKSRGRNLSEKEKFKKLNAALSKHPIANLNNKHDWLLKPLCKAGLLGAAADVSKYVFTSADAMRYLSGGWLEEWAWDIAKSCIPDQCAANVFIRSLADSSSENQSNKSDNELDLVILHNNRLLIAECKTILWEGASAKQEIFNKLDALGTHARGLFGASLLISAKPLDEIAARRAKAYGVKVLQANGLPQLKNEILRWMGKPLEAEKPQKDQYKKSKPGDANRSAPESSGPSVISQAFAKARSG